ncbi:UNVERIFIED_CONTAM: hypothetical protein PYX00_010953 [Menopon gallinae]|uniref:ABC transporter domain-containing protein n=1 Tax=Menopon gallinae TaxID=328185 RepID=A0AAW2H6V3_9NEOP
MALEERSLLGLLSLENITYRYENEPLLNNINFTLYEGQIHSLLYNNPHECELLIKILSGQLSPKEYFGNLYWASKPVLFSTPRVPLSLGLALACAPPYIIKEFSIQENIFLGIEEEGGDSFLDKEREEKETWNWLKLFRLPFSPQTLLADLDPDIYYLFAILRSLNCSHKLLVLHQELVEALSPRSQEILRQYLVKQHSHKTSRLEKGQITLKWLNSQAEEEESLDSYFQPNWVLPRIQRNEEYEDALLSFLGWEGARKSGAKPQKLVFHCYKAKMQGLGGLAYHNRLALRQILSGFDKALQPNTLLWRGKPLLFENPIQALESRLAVIPREYQLIKEFSIKENLLLKVENSRMRLLLDEEFYLEKFEAIFKRYHFELPSWHNGVDQLSVLETQLLLLAQALVLEPLFIFLEDPTWQLKPSEKELYFEILNLVCKNNISLLVLCSSSWDFAYLPCRKVWLEEGQSIENLLLAD